MPRLRPLAPLAVLYAVGVALLLVALPPNRALATKEYAQREKQDCSHCHINPKGSGPRNATGKEFEANGHRFGVASWSSEENSAKYLRAKAALTHTWYGEADRLLDELESDETLPGGRALVEGTRKTYGMFARTWLRSARKLLEKGTRGLPNALEFLTKLESQFPATDEGKAATELLDGLAAKDASRKPVADARAAEAGRLVYVRARTELELGDFAAARKLLGQVIADEAAAAYHDDARQVLSEMPDGS